MQFRLKLGALALAGGAASLLLAGVPALASTHPGKSITGPEVLAGTVYGKAALVNAPTIPLQWRGLVYTHSMIHLGGGGTHNGNVKKLPSPAGVLTVRISSKPQSHQSFDMKTCRLTFTEELPVTVVGSMSTGAFAGASGPGAAQVRFTAFTTRYKSGPHKGQCNGNGKPLAKGATASFLASTVLTLK